MGESPGGAEGRSGGPHSGFGVLGALEVWYFCSGGGPVGRGWKWGRGLYSALVMRARWSITERISE